MSKWTTHEFAKHGARPCTVERVRAGRMQAGVAALFTAGFFLLLIAAHGLRHPMEKPAKLPLAMKLAALRDLVPTMLLIFLARNVFHWV